jgi:hypothetical protein
MRPMIWLGLAAALLLCAGCDYPQAGYYALIGHGADGKAVLRLPFGVEELVDDTEMTTGYMLLLPAPPENGSPCVIEAPVENGTDFTRRSWLCALAQVDTRLCDLHLELIHADEQLTFSGAYRAASFDPVSRIAAALAPGSAAGANRIEFRTNQPQFDNVEEIASWELVPLELKSFEQAIGGKLAQAKRLKATMPDQAFLDAALLAEQVPLEDHTVTGSAKPGTSPAQPKKPAKPKPADKKKVPPTLGGRGSQRPH